MSASDDEAFASAEEGEGSEASAAPEKEKKSETSKTKGQGSQGPGKDKAGGKQKGKQQQQRKNKAKTETKSQAERKEKPSQKKPASDTPPKTEKSTDKSETKEAVTCETDKQKGAVASAKFSDTNSGSSECAESSRDTAKETDSPSVSQVSKTETESKKETEKQETSDKSVSGTAPETPAKTAGEIRQNLSSNTLTEETKVTKPADQSIPRDAGDASKDSGEECKQEAAEGSNQGDGGGGWGWGWGSSILTAATNSLETFSSQVGEGLTTIIDSVESSLGVPDPEELARAQSAVETDKVSDGTETVTAQPQEKEASEEPTEDKAASGEKDKQKEKEESTAGAEATEKENEAQQGSSWLSGWGMSSISNMGKTLVNKSQDLMNTGFEKAETFAAGGLDILETIGKKTYTTLTEHDPGLRRAREFLHQRKEKPSLSSVLREAQAQAEEQAKQREEMEEARKYNFTAVFEDNQGLAHLEALEMLSNQSERKVQSLLSAMDDETLENIRPQLVEIKDIFQQACEHDEKDQSEEPEHDFSKLVTENLSELHLGTAPDKLNKVQETVRQWIADFYSHEDHNEVSDPKEVQQRAIQSLADVTSKAVEQFHKAGELVLMQKDEEKSCTHRAQNLAKLSSVLVTEVDILASKFSECLNKIGEEKNQTEEVSPMVTTVYLEASNASGYIQDAFQLLLPVLQHAAIQSTL